MAFNQWDESRTNPRRNTQQPLTPIRAEAAAQGGSAVAQATGIDDDYGLVGLEAEMLEALLEMSQ